MDAICFFPVIKQIILCWLPQANYTSQCWSLRRSVEQKQPYRWSARAFRWSCNFFCDPHKSSKKKTKRTSFIHCSSALMMGLTLHPNVRADPRRPVCLERFKWEIGTTVLSTIYVLCSPCDTTWHTERRLQMKNLRFPLSRCLLKAYIIHFDYSSTIFTEVRYICLDILKQLWMCDLHYVQHAVSSG